MGYPFKIVRQFMKTWPVINLLKRLSGLPILKYLSIPFLAERFNQVTEIPIQIKIEPMEGSAIPYRLVERLAKEASYRFITKVCFCRDYKKCDSYSRDIGCLFLGEGARKIHPSNGNEVTFEEARKHIRNAAGVGLIASISHVWIDPVGFGLPQFGKLLTICFCDDCCCLFRTALKSVSPGFHNAMRRLDGIVVKITEDCVGCGECVASCFVGAITIENEKAEIGKLCKGCGKCVDSCPVSAAKIYFEDENTLYRKLVDRVTKYTDFR